jgi:2-polyprenyl-3-methyl-5-hydroxy-6-metoxy-1,4-benzoquinol methylase
MKSSSNQKKIFDAEYAASPHIPAANPLHQRLISLIGKLITPNATVLDLGAGPGLLLDSIPEHLHCTKQAVDISSEAVDILNRKGIQAQCINLETEALPYGTDTADMIICTEMLEHLTDPDVVLREIHRVLKPTGILITSVPNINQLITPFLYLFDLPPINAARYGSIHYRDFTKRIFTKALKNNGFLISKMQGDSIFPFKNIISRSIASLSPRLSYHLIAVCTPDKSHPAFL